MTLSNYLTISRFILTGVFIFLIYMSGLAPKIVALIVFLGISITDYLDGYLARKYDQVSDFGKIMDPIADKFFVLSAFCIFAHMGAIPWWMVIVIAVREIVITSIRIAAIKEGKILAAEPSGKYKTILQLVTIGVILVFFILWEAPIALDWWSDRSLAWAKIVILLLTGMTVLLTLLSGISFFLKNRISLHVS